jgi:urease accessory protein
MSHNALKNAVLLLLLCAMTLCWIPAFAHNDVSHMAMSIGSGFAHPFSGIDHLLAMLAVGLWAGQSQRPAHWIAPATFLIVMTIGAALGTLGIHLPGIEAGIASTVAVLGLLVVFAVRLPLWSSSVLVSTFALVHGYAHGLELPRESSVVMYCLGFIAATMLLNVVGISIGMATQGRPVEKLVKLTGAGVAATGVYLLANIA